MGPEDGFGRSGMCLDDGIWLTVKENASKREVEP